jgi:hypothetical protein
MLRTLTLRSLRSAGSCWALTTACVQGFKSDASNLARCRPRRQSFRTSLASGMASEAKSEGWRKGYGLCP